MSELRSVLDQLRMLDPDSIGVEELDVELVEALGGIQTLQVLVAELTKACPTGAAIMIWVIRRLRPTCRIGLG